MKSDNATELRTCPRCGAQYGGYPALSRKYPNTQICPDTMSEGCPTKAWHGRHATKGQPRDCGTREALESIGVSADEQEKIISIIHNKTHSSDR